MTPPPLDIFGLALAAVGGGSLVASVGTVVVAWIGRKPKETVEAETQVAHAAAAVSLSKAFGELVSGLQEELDRKEAELAAMRVDIHKLRNRLIGLDGFVRALLLHKDAQDAMIHSLGGTPIPSPVLPTFDTI